MSMFMVLSFYSEDILAITAPAKIAYTEGKVIVIRYQKTKPQTAKIGMSVFYGDTIKTLRKGRCQVNMAASGILRLSKNTTVTFPIESNKSDKVSVIKMLQGKTWTNIKQLAKDEVFEVRAPKLVAAVQGTKIIVSYDPKTGVATLGVGSGKVKAILNDQIEKLLSTAKQISVDSNGKISAILDIDPAKLQQEFTDKTFKNTNTEVEDLFLSMSSPVDESEVSKENVTVEGSFGKKDINRVDILVKEDSKKSNKTTRFRAIAKNGNFKKDVKLFKGNNIITVSARSKDGKRINRNIKVAYIPGNALEIKLSSPVNTESNKETIQVSGTVNFNDVKSVILELNGSELGKTSVKNGSFLKNINLTEGKNYIKISGTSGRKTAIAQAEINYTKIPEKVDLVISSPVSNMNVTSDIIDYMGYVNDRRITEGKIRINGRNTGTFKLTNGQFRSTLKLRPGKNTIEFIVANPEKKSASVTRTIILETASAESLNVFSPNPAIPYSNKEIPVSGQLGVSSVKQVYVYANGVRIATIPVNNGNFSANISVPEGATSIEIRFTDNGKTYKKIIQIKTSGSVEDAINQGSTIKPQTTILFVEAGAGKGQLTVNGTVIAQPIVKYVNVYLDTKLYGKVIVENNQFKAKIQLVRDLKQIRVVPLWENFKEFSPGAAVWSDKESPTVDIHLPIANKRYTTNDVEVKPNIIKVLGIITDKTLKEITYKVNLDIPKIVTYTGTNVVNYTVPLRLYTGQNTIYIQAKDFFGNNAQKSTIVYFDPIQTATVSSGVIDKFTKQPLTGALVQLYPISGQKVTGTLQAVTNKDGKWTINNVPEGKYIIIVAHNHYLPGQKEIYVKGGTLTNVPTTTVDPASTLDHNPLKRP